MKKIKIFKIFFLLGTIMMNKAYSQNIIIFTGASGGGKSTLLEEMKRNGYRVIEEAGRSVIRNSKKNGITIDPVKEADLFIKESLEFYLKAMKELKDSKEVILMDRSPFDILSYYMVVHNLNSLENTPYEKLIPKIHHCFNEKVFFVPPWKEIYVQDDERKHDFEKGVKEYHRLMKYYTNLGLKIITIPTNLTIKERFRFVKTNL